MRGYANKNFSGCLLEAIGVLFLCSLWEETLKPQCPISVDSSLNINSSMNSCGDVPQTKAIAANSPQQCACWLSKQFAM